MPTIEKIKGGHYYEIGKLSRNPIVIFFQCLKVKKLINKIRPDILHAHSAGTYGLLGAFSDFHPFIVTVWGSDVLLNKGINQKLVKFILKKADLITCDGDNTTDEMISLGVNKQKIKRIYFGVDTDKFRINDADIVLRKNFFNADQRIVISIRNLEPVYDVETLIKAIPLVLEKQPKTGFIIAGNGSQRKYLEYLSVNLKIEKSIKFVGSLEPKELVTYFNISDVYVSTSLSDSGLAASTAEAMACGLPVVVTDSGDNKKWVKERENGFVVDKKNFVLLAEKIIYILEHEELNEKISKTNREAIVEKNSYRREMEKMEKLYAEVFVPKDTGALNK